MTRLIGAAFAAALILSCAPTANAWENTNNCASPAERDSLTIGNYPSGFGGSTLSKVRKTFGSENDPYTGRQEWIQYIDTTPGQPGGNVLMSSYSWAWCPNNNVRIHGYFNADGTDPNKLNGNWILYAG